LKNLLLINRYMMILLLSDTCAGSIHDKRLADAYLYPLPAGSWLLQDLGFLGFSLANTEILTPFKKPRGNPLSPAQKSFNRQLSSLRVRIEHVISSVKRCRIIKDPCRLRGIPVQDMVMEIACALHNFRLSLSPWLPLVKSK
jgi:hypothetical protein